MLVCNYGIGGNMPGRPIFTTGKAGTKCPTGFVNNRGLCKKKTRNVEKDAIEVENDHFEYENEELAEYNDEKSDLKMN